LDIKVVVFELFMVFQLDEKHCKYYWHFMNEVMLHSGISTFPRQLNFQLYPHCTVGGSMCFVLLFPDM